MDTDSRFPIFSVRVIMYWCHHLSRNLYFVSGKGYLEMKLWAIVHFLLWYHRHSQRKEPENKCTLTQINTCIHMDTCTSSSKAIALSVSLHVENHKQFQPNTTSLFWPSLFSYLQLPSLALSLVLIKHTLFIYQHNTKVYVNYSFKTAYLYPYGRQKN